MQAIIFANRNGSELTPLNQHYCPALLPVANKPVIEYTLDSLKQAGIHHAKVVVANDASLIQAHLQQGLRWGVELDYFLSKPQESVASVLSKMQLDDSQPVLVIRGDILRGGLLSQFIEFSQHMQHTFINARMSGLNPGLAVFPAGKPVTACVDWPLRNISSTQRSHVSQLLHGECFHLNDFENIIKANQYVIQHHDQFTLQGRQLDNPQFSQWVEHQTAMPNTLDFEGSVGAFSHIDEHASISNTLVVGEHCLIGASILSNCVVMPNTAIGAGLEMHNMIISRNIIINALTAQVIESDDPAIVSANHPAKSAVNLTTSASSYPASSHLANNVSNSPANSVAMRLCALMTLLISLPVLLGAVLFALVKQQSVITRSQTQSNSKANITLLTINVPNKVIARLPQLLHVVTGQLNMFGAAPKTITADDVPTIVDANAPRRYGVFGPVQLFLPQAPAEEIALVELEYSLLSQLGYARKLLQLGQ